MAPTREDLRRWQRAHNPKVVGSNPTPATKESPAQRPFLERAGRASDIVDVPRMCQGDPKARSKIAPIDELAVRWWVWMDVPTALAGAIVVRSHCWTSTAWRCAWAS